MMLGMPAAGVVVEINRAVVVELLEHADLRCVVAGDGELFDGLEKLDAGAIGE